MVSISNSNRELPESQMQTLTSTLNATKAPVTKENLSTANMAVNTHDQGSEAANKKNRTIEVARKFEALLLHSLLKNMRKTTLSEGTSNERSIYDDMMDQQLANTISESGGLGLANRIAEQLQTSSAQISQNSKISNPQVLDDSQRLRDLALHIESRPQGAGLELHTNSLLNNQTTDIAHLRLATQLWSSSAEKHNNLSSTHQEFLQDLLPHAQRGARRIGTSPTTLLAIAALETGWGQSMITDENGKNSHNLFGIKASATDSDYAITRTTEYIEGSAQKLNARFKTFENDADAVDGFTYFLTDNPRYKKALLHANEPERFVRELQKAGYATDPHYADKVISIMRQIEQ